jgi:hypothetical protein
MAAKTDLAFDGRLWCLANVRSAFLKILVFVGFTKGNPVVSLACSCQRLIADDE